MARFDLQSEVYGALGNITGRGVTRALGRPHLSMLAVLVRETVQNSLDARREKSAEVGYAIRLDERRGETLRAIRSALKSGERNAALSFERVFRGIALDTLIIEDRGTIGLDGPTRADVALDGKARNFADFFRNIGEAPGDLGTGGTYGYGKAVLFVASEVNTVLVYTRTRNGRSLESRLMGMTLCDASISKDAQAKRCTGRHWWGVRGADDVVDPLLDDGADERALTLGFRSFGSDTGTQIMILAPRLEGDDRAAQVTNLLQEALLYAWPWTCGLGRSKTLLKLSGSADGTAVKAPEVGDYTALREMQDALASIRTPTGEESPIAANLLIQGMRPAKDLGRLVLRRFFRGERKSLPECVSPATQEVPARHVAWMRGARLIVRYYQGPESTSPDVEYAGVFVVDDDAEVERAFSDSEPPTHDDWLPEFVSDKRSQSFVRVGVRRIRDAVEGFVLPKKSSNVNSAGGVAGWLSAGLAGLLPGSIGERPGLSTGPRPGGGGGSGRGTSVRALLSFTGNQRWERRSDGTLTVALEYRIHSEAKAGTVIEAVPQVLVGDGAEVEDEAPAGAEAIAILGWRAGGRMVSNEATFRIPERLGDNPWIVIAAPREAMVTVQLTTRTGQ